MFQASGAEVGWEAQSCSQQFSEANRAKAGLQQQLGAHEITFPSHFVPKAITQILPEAARSSSSVTERLFLRTTGLTWLQCRALVPPPGSRQGCPRPGGPQETGGELGNRKILGPCGERAAEESDRDRDGD